MGSILLAFIPNIFGCVIIYSKETELFLKVIWQLIDKGFCSYKTKWVIFSYLSSNLLQRLHLFKLVMNNLKLFTHLFFFTGLKQKRSVEMNTTLLAYVTEAPVR